MPLVTKSTYARMRDRAPSAVSNWIADGKLKAPALVQDDNGDEMVDVDKADAMLAAELDPSQQAAQKHPIGVAQIPAEVAEAASAEPKVEPEDPDNRRFIRARADVKEAEAEGLRRKRLEETGKWYVAEEADAAHAKDLGAAIAETEAWLLGTLSERFAAELNVERAAAIGILRREWRAFRERQAAARRGAPVPALAAE